MNLLKGKIFGITRGMLVGIALLFQVGFILAIVYYLQEYASYLYILLELSSVILALRLLNEGTDYKYYWILIVLALPVFGYFLYFMWGRSSVNNRTNKRIRKCEDKASKWLKQEHNAISELTRLHPNKVQISRYLSRQGYPLYKNTDVKYFSLGEQLIESMINDLENANKFIFMEYFIIDEGEIWSKIQKILYRKAADGLEVRLLMDDLGCLLINDNDFHEEMRKHGIKVEVFGKIHEDINRFTFNFRDHKKITVIDGNIAYTGGINLADEYANVIERFGHWKDTGVRLEGEGVWSLTCFFLEMWETVIKRDIENYTLFKPTIKKECRGYVQPYMGGPHKVRNNPSEFTYTHLINKARDYLYITTPYLILDEKMKEDLITAASSGVDVKIITPRIYDKWYVHMVTIYNYGLLMENGVKIYEYTKGFIHAKNVVSDDECATCGTVNLDYRSLHMHYECGVLMSENQAVIDIRNDFIDTLKLSERINYQQWKQRPWHHKLIQWCLKIFSPML